ncbi:hypothetical protein D3C75_599060 [compost metagenome]
MGEKEADWPTTLDACVVVVNGSNPGEVRARKCTQSVRILFSVTDETKAELAVCRHQETWTVEILQSGSVSIHFAFSRYRLCDNDYTEV